MTLTEIKDAQVAVSFTETARIKKSRYQNDAVIVGADGDQYVAVEEVHRLERDEDGTRSVVDHYRLIARGELQFVVEQANECLQAQTRATATSRRFAATVVASGF